jgi:hypothetical protein
MKRCVITVVVYTLYTVNVLSLSASILVDENESDYDYVPVTWHE